MSIILSSAYNASIQYYSKFLLEKEIIIEQNDTYIKQSYRNRCVICSADAPMSLSIPVVYSAKERTKTKDVLISEHGNWRHKHWNAIVSAYNSSPFFEYYRDDYEKFYFQEYTSLLHFNDSLLRLTLENLNIEIPSIQYSDKYLDTSLTKALDYRETIHPKIDWRADELFKVKEYYQVFGDKYVFSPNMSVLDLLFNMGNESLLILLNSIVSVDSICNK